MTRLLVAWCSASVLLAVAWSLFHMRMCHFTPLDDRLAPHEMTALDERIGVAG